MYCEKIGYFQTGLFGCIANSCTIDSLVMINPIVKARGMAGALVGYTLNGGNLYISECLLVNILVDCSLGSNTGNNNSLVQPFGTNGVYTIASDGTAQYSFHETARYHISDITINDIPYGVITSYDFEYVHENHTIVATYSDACGIQALPFSDSFEGTSTSQVPNGTAGSYTVEYEESGFTPGSGIFLYPTTTTVDLTGLTSGSAYTVYVTAECGGIDGSSSPATSTFNTAMCDAADQCAFTFNLVDSYGDGWNGASLEVKQNGIVVATLTTAFL